MLKGGSAKGQVHKDRGSGGGGEQNKKGRKEEKQKRKFKKKRKEKSKEWETKRTYTLERERKAERRRWREKPEDSNTQARRDRMLQLIRPGPSTAASEAPWLWELGQRGEFVFTVVRLRGHRSFPKGLCEVTCSGCTFPNRELLPCAPEVRPWARRFLL